MLQQDKELLVFPAVSAIATLVVIASFMLPLFGLLDLKAISGSQQSPPAWLYVWGFLFYLVQYFVIFYFNSALVGAAMIRLEGGDPTVADGLRIARSKFGVILGYAAIAATVGMILRAIEERSGLIGKWITGLIGAAWTVVSFLTVPVLVMRDVGPLDAVKESALLLKQTWGENVIGQGGVGLLFGLLQFVLVFAFGAFGVLAFVNQQVWLGGGIFAIGVGCMIALALVQSALSGIYSAVLYRHAAGLQPAAGFDPGLLAHAFAVKAR